MFELHREYDIVSKLENMASAVYGSTTIPGPLEKLMSSFRESYFPNVNCWVNWSNDFHGLDFITGSLLVTRARSREVLLEVQLPQAVSVIRDMGLLVNASETLVSFDKSGVACNLIELSDKSGTILCGAYLSFLDVAYLGYELVFFELEEGVKRVGVFRAAVVVHIIE